MDSQDKYKEILKQLRQDEEDLAMEEANLVDQQILINDQLVETRERLERVRETKASIRRLLGEEGITLDRPLSLRSFTLTEAVRKVLKSATEPLTAMAVRDRLLENKFNASKFTNLLASVHTTLKRLESSGELLPHKVDGKVAYTLNPDYKPPAMELIRRAQ